MRAARRRGRVHVRESREHGVELRVDGTLASTYRPGRPGTGSVWDALAAPLLLLPPGRRRRILVLGLGGGSAARLCRALAREARVVGVEIDGEVLAAARRHLGLDALGIETVHADARVYLERARGAWDLVVDDVFTVEGRRVFKPAWSLEPSLAAARVLAPGGALSVNTIHETPAAVRAIRSVPGGVVTIGVGGYWNRILAAGEPVRDARAVRAAVAAEPLLARAFRRLSFRTWRGAR